jgi:hypothetical protein
VLPWYCLDLLCDYSLFCTPDSELLYQTYAHPLHIDPQCWCLWWCNFHPEFRIFYTSIVWDRIEWGSRWRCLSEAVRSDTADLLFMDWSIRQAALQGRNVLPWWRSLIPEKFMILWTLYRRVICFNSFDFRCKESLSICMKFSVTYYKGYCLYQ